MACSGCAKRAAALRGAAKGVRTGNLRKVAKRVTTVAKHTARSARSTLRSRSGR